MNPKNHYFLLRHGETIYQTEKIDILYPWPEKNPVILTKKGERQIKKAAKELKKKDIDLIYSSDIFRARQTAEIVSRELGLKVNFDKRLRDLNMGIFQAGPKIAYQKFFPSRRKKFEKRPPKGESWADVKKRVSDFLKEIEKKHKNKKFLIISHGDPLWLLAGILKGLNNKNLLEKKYSGGIYPNVGQFLEPK